MNLKRITPDDLQKIERTAVRQERKEQGALDGRFRPRVQPSKKVYKRKPKHRLSEQGWGFGSAQPDRG